MKPAALRRDDRMVRVRAVSQTTGAEELVGDFELLDFLDQELADDDRAALLALQPGCRHWIGGGAAQLFLISRLT